MIAIVDYGAGNISSVKKALEHLGASAQLTSDPSVIAAAQKIIIPGVGHFSRCEIAQPEFAEAGARCHQQGNSFSGHLRGHAVAV